MRNKKSVLKTLSVSYDCSNGAVTGIAGNGTGMTSGGLRVQNFQNTIQNERRYKLAN